ncbi:MAG TPA: FAD-dependent oxidoreductase [Miltoncostaeaceae bacterium]|nr:FAD-dependent oxidoreductase [Miltoncostaeaceae bacterium]
MTDAQLPGGDAASPPAGDPTGPAGDRVAVIGGGLTGLTLAYRLTQAGVGVDLYEASEALGGLAGDMEFDGARVDRFYHVILPTDDRVIGLAQEVGLDTALEFTPTGVGFFHSGRLDSISSIGEFLRFSLLTPLQRVRLAAFVAYCQAIPGWRRIDRYPLVDWIRRCAGGGVYRRMWRPILEAKFDGDLEGLSATWLWQRTRRMSGARRRGSQEVCGALEGGYQTLVDRLAERIRAAGGRILTSTPVEAVTAGDTPSVTVDGEVRPYRLVTMTVLPPVARRLLGDREGRLLRGTPERYLGIVCVLLKTRRSLSPYYTINIADPEVGLTGVIETTRVLDPQGERDHALVYLPKYVDPSNPLLDAPDAEVEARFVAGLRRIFPDFDPARDVIASRVMRARLAEPVHGIGAGGGVPGTFDPAAPGIAFASTAQIFPTVVSGQATIGLAEAVLPEIRRALDGAPAGAPAPVPAAV